MAEFPNSLDEALLGALASAVDEIFSTLVPTSVERVNLSSVAIAEGGSTMEIEAPDGESSQVALDLEARVDFFQEELKGRAFIRCDTEGAGEITRSMLMMEEGDPVEEQDVLDALGECANMLAGTVKTRLLDAHGEYRLGLPEVGSPRADGHTCPSSKVAYLLSKGALNIEVWLLGEGETA